MSPVRSKNKHSMFPPYIYIYIYIYILDPHDLNLFQIQTIGVFIIPRCFF